MKWTQAAAIKLMQDWKDKTPCFDCGGNFRYYQKDFDHLGAKVYNLGTQGKKLNEVTLRIEMAKCDVVCANCHRARTYLRQVQPRKKQ